MNPEKPSKTEHTYVDKNKTMSEISGIEKTIMGMGGNDVEPSMIAAIKESFLKGQITDIEAISQMNVILKKKMRE